MQSPLFATEAGNEVVHKKAHYQQAVHSHVLSMSQGEIMLLMLRFLHCADQILTLLKHLLQQLLLVAALQVPHLLCYLENLQTTQL